MIEPLLGVSIMYSSTSRLFMSWSVAEVWSKQVSSRGHNCDTMQKVSLFGV